MTYKTVTVTSDIDVDMDDFDDEDIREEYESRFGIVGVFGWSTIYEKRRSLSPEEFLKWFDVFIQDNSGRILV